MENVVVTGFGPFAGHQINASWEAVKLLKHETIDGINFVLEEIPVVYDYIDKTIPFLWEKYNPKLVVHVGVSALTSVVQLEKLAFRTGYNKADCLGCLHKTGAVVDSCLESDEYIGTYLNIEQICRLVKEQKNITVLPSQNAGRYLCEFTFYKSLTINRQKTLFVHVPPLNKPLSANELCEVIKCIITCALEQL